MTDTLCQLMFESIDCDNGMQRNWDGEGECWLFYRYNQLGEKNSNDFTMTLVNMQPDQISISKQVEPSTFPLPPPSKKKNKKKKQKKEEKKKSEKQRSKDTLVYTKFLDTYVVSYFHLASFCHYDYLCLVDNKSLKKGK